MVARLLPLAAVIDFLEEPQQGSSAAVNQRNKNAC
jgi:hypothetical protein